MPKTDFPVRIPEKKFSRKQKIVPHCPDDAEAIEIENIEMININGRITANVFNLICPLLTLFLMIFIGKCGL
jgi:hypothetical protein